jgi:hypothetical protein
MGQAVVFQAGVVAEPSSFPHQIESSDHLETSMTEPEWLEFWESGRSQIMRQERSQFENILGKFLEVVKGSQWVEPLAKG